MYCVGPTENVGQRENTGLIVGSVLGATVPALIIVIGVVYVFRRYKIRCNCNCVVSERKGTYLLDRSHLNKYPWAKIQFCISNDC